MILLTVFDIFLSQQTRTWYLRVSANHLVDSRLRLFFNKKGVITKPVDENIS